MAYDRIEHAGGAVDTTLASDITSLDTTLSVAASTAWPDGSDGPFYVLIDPGTASEEKMLATSLSGVTLSGLVRGVDGTGAFDHTAGVVVKHVFSATEADEANFLVNRTVGQITGKGDLSVGSAANNYGLLAAPASHRALIGDTGASLGMAWGQITEDELAAATFGAGLTGGNGTTVTALTDGTTIDTSGAGSSLEVKALGVGTAQLAALGVTAAKLAADSVTTAKILDANVTTAKIADANVTAAKIAAEAWTSYTPTWGSTSTGGGSVSLIVGNATTAGAYIQYGKIVHVRFSVTVGSTTTLGSSVIYTFTLPVAPKTGVYQTIAGSALPGTAVTSHQFLLSARTDAAAGTTLPATAVSTDGTLLGPSNPFTAAAWVTGTVFTFTGTYEAN